MLRPSQIEIPVFYPNGDPKGGPGMDQGDYDHGEVGADDFRSIAELLEMPTFNRLDPEFQRCYIGVCVAAKLEAGLILGLGTGWRSWETQLANHLANPKQFAHPMYSLHMNRGKRNVAWAIDSVPYDALGFAHANCRRFNIRYLDHIPNELHHCQPDRLPAGGSQFTDAYADLAAERRDIPYLRMMSLAEWLERDAPIYLDGRPEAPPTPTPTPDPDPVPEEDDDMAKPYICRTANPYELRMGPGDGGPAVVLRSREYTKFKADWTGGKMPPGRRFYHPLTGEALTPGSWATIPQLSEEDADTYVGYPDYVRTKADEG